MTDRKLTPMNLEETLRVLDSKLRCVLIWECVGGRDPISELAWSVEGAAARILKLEEECKELRLKLKELTNEV